MSTAADRGEGITQLRALVEQWRVEAEDCKSRGYLEAWNERLVCANELEAALSAVIGQPALPRTEKG